MITKLQIYIGLFIISALTFYTYHIFYANYEKVTHIREKYLKEHHNDINIAVVWPDYKDTTFIKGVELAKDLINAKNNFSIEYTTDKNEKINRKINIIYYPEGSKKQGQESAKLIAEDKTIAAVIGHDRSTTAIPASISYQYNGIVYMSPVATSNVLTQHKFTYVFRNAPRDTDFAKALFNFCNKRGLKKIAVLYSRGTYGTNFSDIFVEIAAGFNIEDEQDLGDLQKVMTKKDDDPKVKAITEVTNNSATPKNKLQIVVQKSYSPESHDFLHLVSELSPYDYDCIFIAGLLSNKAGELIKQLRRFDINVPIIGGDGLDSALLSEIPNEASNNTFVASVFSHDALDKDVKGNDKKVNFDLRKEYKLKYGIEPDYDAAQGFEALFVLAQAFVRARSTSPLLVSSTLRAFDDFIGASGKISFSNDGDIEQKVIFIKEMKNGEFIRVGD